LCDKGTDFTEVLIVPYIHLPLSFLNEGDQSLDLHGLPEGIYTVRILQSQKLLAVNRLALLK
jgi:hypothetical protein